MALKRWSPVFLYLVKSLTGHAQTSNVTTCIPEWQWSINDKGQTPCLVAAYLETACGTPTSVDGIPNGTHYLGPTAGQQDPCICSSVTYSMVSACGGCQGRTYQSWTAWKAGCERSSITTFPVEIPAEVDVPAWGFINISLVDNVFDPAIAQGDKTWPISSISTATSSESRTATVAPSNVPTGPAISNTQTSSKHINSGAIVGGILAGVTLLCIKFAFSFLKSHIRQRQRRRTSQATGLNNTMTETRRVRLSIREPESTAGDSHSGYFGSAQGGSGL